MNFPVFTISKFFCLSNPDSLRILIQSEQNVNVVLTCFLAIALIFLDESVDFESWEFSCRVPGQYINKIQWSWEECWIDSISQRFHEGVTVEGLGDDKSHEARHPFISFCW